MPGDPECFEGSKYRFDTQSSPDGNAVQVVEECYMGEECYEIKS